MVSDAVWAVFERLVEVGRTDRVVIVIKSYPGFVGEKTTL